MFNKAEISGTPSGQIDAKRVYFPGVTLTAPCPCGKTLVCDFETTCLYYPVIDEPIDVILYCDVCDTGTVTVQIRLNVSITLVDNDG